MTMTMTMNRIQFHPCMSLAAFLPQYGTEVGCASALAEGVCFPRCAGRRYNRRADRHGERLWQCATCRHQTSLISDTLFATTKLP